MVDLLENLDMILGVLVNIIFLFIGAGLTYFVQSRTQNKTWKREYSIRIATDVYGKLFGNFKSIIESLEQKHYTAINYWEVWEPIKKDHRYFMIEEKFRNKLDNFYERAKKYTNALNKRTNDILPKIIFEEIKKIFDIEIHDIRWFNVKYFQHKKERGISVDIIECLVHETHPKDRVLRNNPETQFISVSIEGLRKKGIPHYPNSEDTEKFWQTCLQRMRNEDNYKFIISENDSLLADAIYLIKELSNRIETPWKI